MDAGRNPVFDFSAAAGGEQAAGGNGGVADPAAEAALAARAAAAWGDGEEEAEEGGSDGEQQAADAAGSGSQRRRPPVGRVLKTGAAAEQSHLVRLLHACARAGDWASLVAHLRALPPVQVDAEIRAMQVGAGLGGAGGSCRWCMYCAGGPCHLCAALPSRSFLFACLLSHRPLLPCPPYCPQVLEGGPEEDLEHLALLLQFLEEETATHTNFEFVQALLRVTLQVHGETIVEHAELRERAQRAQQRLAATWRRLDGLLQSTRCMVGFLGNLQA